MKQPHLVTHLLSKVYLSEASCKYGPVCLVAGEQSLRKCFEYFEDVDVNVHGKFFRRLEISDNVIKGKEHLNYEDKIHELLNIWIEKEGRQASLNDLLKALLDLNQRRTAEVIKDKAVDEGHYSVCEDQEERDFF